MLEYHAIKGLVSTIRVIKKDIVFWQYLTSKKTKNVYYIPLKFPKISFNRKNRILFEAMKSLKQWFNNWKLNDNKSRQTNRSPLVRGISIENESRLFGASQRSINSENRFFHGPEGVFLRFVQRGKTRELGNIFRRAKGRAGTVFSGGTTWLQRTEPGMFSDIRFARLLYAAGGATASIFYKITIRLVSPATSLFGQLFAADFESLDIIAPCINSALSRCHSPNGIVGAFSEWHRKYISLRKRRIWGREICRKCYGEISCIVRSVLVKTFWIECRLFNTFKALCYSIFLKV